MTVTYSMSERDYHARTELSSTGVRRLLADTRLTAAREYLTRHNNGTTNHTNGDRND